MDRDEGSHGGASRSELSDALERKWAERRNQARKVQRAVGIGVLVLLVFGCGIGGWLMLRFSDAASISACRGNLHRLSYSLFQYCADHDSRLPPAGADVAAALAPYAPEGAYRCRELTAAQPFSYTVAPDVAGLSLSQVRLPDSEAIVMVETGFRHVVSGERMMAVVYLDRRGGQAAPGESQLRGLLSMPWFADQKLKNAPARRSSK